MLHRVERLVRVLQRERDDTRAEIQIFSQGQKVAGILSRHVGYTAKLTLAPEQFVVVEGRHLIHVNGIYGDNSPFAESGESADDHLPAGCEGDGAIKLGGGLCIFVADPGGAERLSGLAVRFAASDYIDIATPGLEDANCKRRRTPK